MKRIAWTLLGLMSFGLFTGLGIWQLERRVWKLELIERVEQRIHAAPALLPSPAQWPGVSAAADEYRRVRVHGYFLHDHEVLVQALTDLGSGFWVLTPLKTPEGYVVFINRGFVPPERSDPATRSAGQIAGETVVTGLLRLNEPKEAFLHSNDPAHGRWYSRDVLAISATQGLRPVAPFFLDADATPNPGGLPVGGLTVVAFRNAHLSYALTWFGLALLSAFATVRFWRAGRPA